MKTLKEVLFEVWIKNLDRGTRFTVDDRGEQDFDAKGQLFFWFCAIHADVLTPPTQRTLGDQHLSAEREIDALGITLHGNVPKSSGVQAWIEANSATLREGDIGSTLEFAVSKGKQDILRSLATAMRAMVASGAPHYDVRSYKYVCPRTADSLERLAETLDSAWSR